MLSSRVTSWNILSNVKTYGFPVPFFHLLSLFNTKINIVFTKNNLLNNEQTIKLICVLSTCKQVFVVVETLQIEKHQRPNVPERVSLALLELAPLLLPRATKSTHNTTCNLLTYTCLIITTPFPFFICASNRTLSIYQS